MSNDQESCGAVGFDLPQRSPDAHVGVGVAPRRKTSILTSTSRAPRQFSRVTFLDLRVREAGKGAVIQLREIVANRDGKSKFDRDALCCVPSTPEGIGIDAIDATSAHQTGRNLRLSSTLRRKR